VATTATTGAAAVAAGLAGETGLVTLRAPFTAAGLPSLTDLVFGGHDVRDTPLALRAAELTRAGVLPAGLATALAGALDAAEGELRHGVTAREAREDPRAAVDRLAADLASFRSRHAITRVVVVDVSSTEAPPRAEPAHASADALLRALDRGEPVLPPSSLYALAAIETGCAFVGFTPSAGARLPALEALAEAANVPLAGSDGKTGETLLKSVLAPMFARRALQVRSWAATNLLGGGDGETLSDPECARSKLLSKARLLEETLGYAVEAPIRMEYVRDLGQWKVAWDHVAFDGFLGVPMRLQFTWEGCDSALAAPLVLDLARLLGLALDRGTSGFVPELAFFFKDPAGSNAHALDRQYDLLERWVLEAVPSTH
jgi:myo-inositol-1-phosphate synthase